MRTGIEPTSTLTERDGYWVAIDVETGVGAQGETREEALAGLDDAVALHAGEGGEDGADESSNTAETATCQPGVSRPSDARRPVCYIVTHDLKPTISAV